MIVALKHLIGTAGERRTSRIALVVLACLALAALSLAIGLGWGLWDALRTVNAQEWLLPIFLAVFFAVMAVFAPFMPIWPLNVPDNEIWMILDSTDHLERFVGSGVYSIKPVQGFEPYPHKGLIPVVADLDQVLTADHFPYKVTVNVTANLNPLIADKTQLKTLRAISKEALANGIRADIIHIVKREMLQFGRQEIDPAALVNAISEAIGQAVSVRKGLGLTLAAADPIKISLEPPREVLAARSELWVEESKAEARVKHMAEVLKLAGATNMSVGDLGRLHFFLTPPADMRINLQGSHDFFQSATPQPTLPAPRKGRTQKALPPPIQMPMIDALSGAELRSPPSEPPLNLPEDIPPRPEPRRAPARQEPTQPNQPTVEPRREPPHKPEPEVIETEQDADGTFVPVNPILKRKKKR